MSRQQFPTRSARLVSRVPGAGAALLRCAAWPASVLQLTNSVRPSCRNGLWGHLRGAFCGFCLVLFLSPYFPMGEKERYHRSCFSGFLISELYPDAFLSHYSNSNSHTILLNSHQCLISMICFYFSFMTFSGHIKVTPLYRYPGCPGDQESP